MSGIRTWTLKPQFLHEKPVEVIELEPILDMLEGWRDQVDKRKQLTKPVEEAIDALLARYRPNP